MPATSTRRLRNKTGPWKHSGDAAVLERMQSVLINAAEGRRSIGDDRQYEELRKLLSRRAITAPSIVQTHPSVDSFCAFITGVPERRRRVAKIRDEFGPHIRSLEGPGDRAFDPSSWTGLPSRAARLSAVRNLMPLAQAAVDGMIATLSEPNSNGAPLLDHRIEAIEQLRELHRTLGELLSAADAGHLEDELGQGLAAEAARYAKRVARSLRDDPMPYLSSALLLGIFSACGLPGIGGYIGGVALAVRKNLRKGVGTL